MRFSEPPTTPSGSNKAVIILLIAGMLVLAAAGAVLYMRRSAPPPKARPVPEALVAPAPLVIATPVKPLYRVADAGPAEKKPKKRRARRPERIGTIDTTAVNKFMNGRFEQVRNCYERRLKSNSFLEGKLDLNIEISLTGKVTNIGVNRDTVKDREMLKCVKQTIRKWPFPQPQGGPVVIAKTFNFKKKNR
jgi:hypothetical protein